VAYAVVELAVVYAVYFLSVVLFALEFVEGVAEGVPALLVEDPCVLLVYEVVV
jgi:hypothetical protein